jgi:hypothetical protein
LPTRQKGTARESERALKTRWLSAEYYYVIRQLFMVCVALASGAFIAQAAYTHPSIPRHHAHAAKSRAPHAADQRHPHAADKHAKPKKPPKHDVAPHQKPPKASKH